MPKVTFIKKNGEQKTVEAPENWSVMQIAVDNDIEEIEGSCGGSLACATCHCYIHPDWVERVEAQDNEKSDEEEDMLDLALDVRDTSRLGCQILVTEDLNGLVIGLPGTNHEDF